jgi:hypothetical protein
MGAGLVSAPCDNKPFTDNPSSPHTPQNNLSSEYQHINHLITLSVPDTFFIRTHNTKTFKGIIP